MLKRTFDFVTASLLLLVASPFILLGALAVKVTSRGPAFYRSRRAGMGTKPFDLLKLRTMTDSPDNADREITDVDDARVTPVGRLLRRFKIDELPQLWNVLRGDMSIVGPRPEDWSIVTQYYTPEQKRTLEARPGITSPSMVRWYPDETYHDPPPPGVSIKEHYLTRHLPVKLAEERAYVEQQNMLLDLKVIAQTLFCVLVRSWLPPPKKRMPADCDTR